MNAGCRVLFGDGLLLFFPAGSCASLFLGALPRRHVPIEFQVVIIQLWLFPVVRNAAVSKIDELLRRFGSAAVFDGVQSGADRIPDDRIQFFHLRIREMLAMKVVH